MTHWLTTILIFLPVAGALVASQLACSEAMPRLADLEAALV